MTLKPEAPPGDRARIAARAASLDPSPQAGRDATVAACLAILVRELFAAGLKRAAAMDVLRDAPDRIEAALTRGPEALVLYRLDGTTPAGMVSTDDARLNRFVADAERDGAPILGLCPHAVAEVASLAGPFAVLKMGGRHAAPAVH